METQRAATSVSNQWTVESKYTTLHFTVRNLFVFTVRGRFTELTGSIMFDPARLGESSVEAVINAASIDTGNKRRDAHLRAADFFSAAQYPEIRFESTRVERGTDRDTLRITGLLTVKTHKREVVLDVTEMERSRSPRGDEVVYYTAVTNINRFDLGLNYGRGIIGSHANVVIHVQAVRCTARAQD